MATRPNYMHDPITIATEGSRKLYMCALRAVDVNATPLTLVSPLGNEGSKRLVLTGALFYVDYLDTSPTDARFQFYPVGKDGLPQLDEPLLSDQKGSKMDALKSLYTKYYSEVAAFEVIHIGCKNMHFSNFFYMMVEDANGQRVPSVGLRYWYQERAYGSQPKRARTPSSTPAVNPGRTPPLNRVCNSSWPGKIADAVRSLKRLKENPVFCTEHAGKLSEVINLKVERLPVDPRVRLEYRTWTTINNRLTSLTNILQRAMELPKAVNINTLVRNIKAYNEIVVAAPEFVVPDDALAQKDPQHFEEEDIEEEVEEEEQTDDDTNHGDKKLEIVEDRRVVNVGNALPVHPTDRVPDHRCVVALRAVTNGRLVTKDDVGMQLDQLLVKGMDYQFVCDLYLNEPGGTVTQVYDMGSDTPLITRKQGSSASLLRSLYTKAYGATVANALTQDVRNFATYFYTLTDAGLPDVVLHQVIVRFRGRRGKSTKPVGLPQWEAPSIFAARVAALTGAVDEIEEPVPQGIISPPGPSDDEEEISQGRKRKAEALDTEDEDMREAEALDTEDEDMREAEALDTEDEDMREIASVLGNLKTSKKRPGRPRKAVIQDDEDVDDAFVLRTTSRFNSNTRSKVKKTAGARPKDCTAANATKPKTPNTMWDLRVQLLNERMVLDVINEFDEYRRVPVLLNVGIDADARILHEQWISINNKVYSAIKHVTRLQEIVLARRTFRAEGKDPETAPTPHRPTLQVVQACFASFNDAIMKTRASLAERRALQEGVPIPAPPQLGPWKTFGQALDEAGELAVTKPYSQEAYGAIGKAGIAEGGICGPSSTPSGAMEDVELTRPESPEAPILLPLPAM